MRRLLTLRCREDLLAASVDEGSRQTGLLIVTGGSQTRIGSHRLFERLAKSLAEAGYPTLRFDRRGVGDSSGEDPGFRDSGLDIAAGGALLRTEAPEVDWVVGIGLCDGATALALHGAAAGVDALILVNPWLVEAEAGAPPPAAIRRHYWNRLTSKEGWTKIASGAVSYRKLFKGIAKAAAPATDSSLAADVATALAANPRPTALILAAGDATAVAAAAEVKAKRFAGLIATTCEIDTDSHTFARPGDVPALTQAVLAVLAKLAPAA
jgi:exosortase A-associated hydrolase 1